LSIAATAASKSIDQTDENQTLLVLASTMIALGQGADGGGPIGAR
jgi:hypothetical protein